MGLQRMLRIYFMQQWFNLSDPEMEHRQAGAGALFPAEYSSFARELDSARKVYLVLVGEKPGF